VYSTGSEFASFSIPGVKAFHNCAFIKAMKLGIPNPVIGQYPIYLVTITHP
jgi:hypothetical protein